MIYSHANLIKAWPTTLNLALSNSQSWLYSFASRRTLGVYRHQEVAGSCDTQTVQTCFSAYCFSDCSMRQTNSSCYQWLRDVIIDTVNSDDDSDLLYKCPTMEVVWRLQLSFATPCTKCVCVRVGTFFLFFSLLFTKQNIENTSWQVSSQYTSMQIYLAAPSVAAPVITSNPMQKQMKKVYIACSTIF